MAANTPNAGLNPPSVLSSFQDAGGAGPSSVLPQTLETRAVTVLNERLGGGAAAVQTRFVAGAVGLFGDQTHYSNGFALLVPLAQGTAVALRPSAQDTTRLVFDGDATTWRAEAARDAPAWVQVAHRVVQRWGGDTPVDGAVVSTVPARCRDAYLAALGVALARGLGSLDSASPQAPATDTVLPALRDIIADCTGLPYSVAYPIAAYAGRSEAFVLVDTATREYLPVETEARDALHWRLIDIGVPPPLDAAAHRERRDRADEALALLREHGFDRLTSFRELEHQQLPHAIEALPPRLHPIVRHLVTENRRVQKMVAALRREDWQMVGALLLMSHASRRDDWASTPEPADRLVSEVERMTLEGIYGAAMTGRGGEIMVVGRPFTMPASLNQLATKFQEDTGHALHVLPL